MIVRLINNQTYKSMIDTVDKFLRSHPKQFFGMIRSRRPNQTTVLIRKLQNNKNNAITKNHSFGLSFQRTKMKQLQAADGNITIISKVKHVTENLSLFYE